MRELCGDRVGGGEEVGCSENKVLISDKWTLSSGFSDVSLRETGLVRFNKMVV